MFMATVRRFVDDLLRGTRPRRFRGTPEDSALARTAITLRAARPGSGVPREEFITGLHKRLAAELGPPVPRRASGGRRSFIRAATLAAGAAAAGAGIDHALTGGGAAPTVPRSPVTLVPTGGAWRFVVTSASLPEGKVVPFEVDGLTGFVERTGGHLRAVSGICTHQGCQLVYTAQPAGFRCPCHGARFATDGSVTWHRPGVTLTRLPRLAVREANGNIEVYAPRPM
jgi:Rieske Fe-S protein